MSRLDADIILKDKIPRSVDAQYAMLLENSGEIAPERMKRWSQSKNNSQLWMWQVMEVKSDAVKNNIAYEPGLLGTWIKVNWKWSNVMARVNINILGISELKWTGMAEFNSDNHCIYYCWQESLRRNGVALIANKRVWNAVLGCNLKNNRTICLFPRQTIQYHSNPSLCPNQ